MDWPTIALRLCLLPNEAAMHYIALLRLPPLLNGQTGRFYGVSDKTKATNQPNPDDDTESDPDFLPDWAQSGNVDPEPDSQSTGGGEDESDDDQGCCGC